MTASATVIGFSKNSGMSKGEAGSSQLESSADDSFAGVMNDKVHQSGNKTKVSALACVYVRMPMRYKLNIVQVYAPTYSEEDINRFYNDVDDTLGKPNHYTIMMGNVNEQRGKRTHPLETATGKFALELRNERGDTLIEWQESTKS